MAKKMGAMAKLNYVFIMMAAIQLGCSDDAGNGLSGNADGLQKGDACTTGCADGLKCDSGVCKVEVGLDGDCSGENSLCSELYICVNGTCTTRCASSEDCKTAEICEDGICRAQGVLGSACIEGETKCIDSKCISGKCQKEIEIGGDCLGEYNVCLDSKCISGKCIKEIEIGGDCSGENSVCIDESKCVEGICERSEDKSCTSDINCSQNEYCDFANQICTLLPDYKEECDGTIGCRDGYICGEQGVCVNHSVETGGSCDSVYDYCDISDYCENGICVKHVETGQTCDSSHVCNNALDRCMDGVCITTGGSCTSESGMDTCKSDMYCCNTDACGAYKDMCVPYGKGPSGDKNELCSYKTTIGLFEPSIQCEWSPAATDAYPKHNNVLMTPLVVNTPHDSGNSNEIIFTAYNCTDGGAPSGQGTDLNCNGVIRILSGETCEVKENIFDDNNHVIGGSNLAIADVDGDGWPEIFASRGKTQKAGGSSGVVAFHWNGESKKYETMWGTAGTNQGWGGPSVHDIDDDGVAEVIGQAGMVYDSLTGKVKNPGNSVATGKFPTIGDLDGDGKVEIVTGVNVYRWSTENNHWESAYTTGALPGDEFAYADFGSFEEDGTTFNFDKFDGRAEVVACNGSVSVKTLEGKVVFSAPGQGGGGPCTVGDFDGDGRPEIAAAYTYAYNVFDPDCMAASAECVGNGIRWQKSSQDASSSSTGSSLFDFEGDGAVEAVYADECYTRVYDGKTGDVLFSSFHSSATWHENPIIVDVDNDESAELIVSSNNKMGCQSPDPVHRGLRCATSEDCKSGNCAGGFCRCTTHDECNSRVDSSGALVSEFQCVDGITDADKVGGKVCRAYHPNVVSPGIRVLRDRLDRWASSRNIWNQHAYAITHINDDMTIPKTVDWVQNFLKKNAEGKNLLNNYRQNSQGARGMNEAPDITGRFTDTPCAHSGDKITLGAVVCNRGTKMVAALMPATFYSVDESNNRTKLCTSYTKENVPIGGCMEVSCEVPEEFKGNIVIVTNDDGNGGKTTVECNANNNEDSTVVTQCPVVVN